MRLQEPPRTDKSRRTLRRAGGGRLVARPRRAPVGESFTWTWRRRTWMRRRVVAQSRTLTTLTMRGEAVLRAGPRAHLEARARPALEISRLRSSRSVPCTLEARRHPPKTSSKTTPRARRRPLPPAPTSRRRPRPQRRRHLLRVSLRGERDEHGYERMRSSARAAYTSRVRCAYADRGCQCPDPTADADEPPLWAQIGPESMAAVERQAIVAERGRIRVAGAAPGALARRRA